MKERGCARDRRDMPFLTARWENLVLLNFDCPRSFLEPLVPRGTELDPWRGVDVVSLVGFHFVDTRVFGVPIPGHRTFEEVNLRFYVRRRVSGAPDRRAVVFIKELVPRRAIAWVARRFYNEPYSALPMGHRIRLTPSRGGDVEYFWRHDDARHTIRAVVSGAAEPLAPGSEAEFITEHYWGYTRQRDESTLEYRVDHPPWSVWDADEGCYDAPPEARLYPPEFAEILRGTPRSVFVARGSAVTVFRGRPL